MDGTCHKKFDYVLTYFTAFGRGEYIRMALVLSKANWKDVAIKDEWFKFKDKTPNGYIPVLSVDGGELMDGTIALVRFVCQRHGLYS